MASTLQSPLKPRTPQRSPARPAQQLLPRTNSAASLVRQQHPGSLLERLHGLRPLRNALLLLISLVLAVNAVWAAQGVAAWRRGLAIGAGGGGLAGGSGEGLVLERLNSTTLSVQVRQVDGSGDDGQQPAASYLVSAQLVGRPEGNDSSGSGAASSAANSSAEGSLFDALGRRFGQPSGGTAAAAAAASSDGSGSGSEGEGLVSQLKGMGSALGGALTAAAGQVKEGLALGGGSASSAEVAGSKAPAPASDPASALAASPPAASPPPPPPAQPSPPPPPPHRAVLKAPEVEERSPDACAQALGTPRVALLFLTRGWLHHHRVWREWFEAARDQLPAEQLRAAACPAASLAGALAAEAAPGEGGQGAARAAAQRQPDFEATAAACGWNASAGLPLEGSGGGNAIDAQHLYSVYVHAPPSVTDEALPSLFRGRLITDRLLPEWGTHQLVEATRNLLWEAYRDPLNQRFVLLSESDVPLYDPLTFHAQLTGEAKSRVNLCRHAAPTDERRWSWRMASPSLKAAHWRKSSQWFGLTRGHVQHVLQDTEVFRKFEAHCWNGWDGDYRRWRDCFSDEHYIPSLLASKGLDNESSCGIDGVVAVDWSAGGPHPRSYKAWEVRPQLFAQVRGAERGCNASHAIQDAQPRFISKQQAFGGSAADFGAPDAAEAADGADGRQRQLCGGALAAVPAYARPLGGTCPLTARKFPKATVRAMARLFADCSSGLQLGPGACQRQQQQEQELGEPEAE